MMFTVYNYSQTNIFLVSTFFLCIFSHDLQAKITHGTYLDLLRTPNLRRRMIIIGFSWFVNLISYIHGIDLMSG